MSPVTSIRPRLNGILKRHAVSVITPQRLYSAVSGRCHHDDADGASPLLAAQPMEAGTENRR